jgi:hypothetical protein
MARVNQDKLDNFHNTLNWLLGDYIKNPSKREDFLDAMSLGGDVYNSLTSRRVLVESQKYLDSINVIQEMVSSLRELLDRHVAIGTDLLFDDRFIEMHNDKMAKPFELLIKLDEFDIWCDAAKSRQTPSKRGRKPDNEGTHIITVIDHLHENIFGKEGSLTPGGFFLETVKKNLEKIGIIHGDEGVRKKIEATRKKLEKLPEVGLDLSKKDLKITAENLVLSMQKVAWKNK